MHQRIEEKRHRALYSIVGLRSTQLDEGGAGIDDPAAEIGRKTDVLDKLALAYD